MAEKNVEKKGFFKNFFRTLKSEWKKIAWPTKEKTFANTTAVIVISAILCGFIRLIDVLSQLVIGWASSIG